MEIVFGTLSLLNAFIAIYYDLAKQDDIKAIKHIVVAIFVLLVAFKAAL